MDSSVTSEMFLSPTVTAKASFLKRFPPQALQGVVFMNVSYSCFVESDAVSRYLLSTFLISPSNATSYTPSPRCPR